jgi:hypothetical protein
MATTFKEGTSIKRRAIFYAYAFAVNSTEIGPWAAGYVATRVATDISVESVVREGAAAVACYFVPAAPLFMYVKKADKAYYLGKKAARYGSLAYKIAKKYTSPIEFVNYVFSKGITTFGLTETMKNYCNVEQCDAFYWEQDSNS